MKFDDLGLRSPFILKILVGRKSATAIKACVRAGNPVLTTDTTTNVNTLAHYYD